MAIAPNAVVATSALLSPEQCGSVLGANLSVVTLLSGWGVTSASSRLEHCGAVEGANLSVGIAWEASSASLRLEQWGMVDISSLGSLSLAFCVTK